MIAHQVDPTHLIIIRGETNVHILGAECSREILEDLLGVKITPNGGLVMERCVSVLTTNDDV